MGSILDNNVAKLDPVALTWTAMNRRSGVPSRRRGFVGFDGGRPITAPSCTGAPTTSGSTISCMTSGTRATNPSRWSISLQKLGPACFAMTTAFLLRCERVFSHLFGVASPQWSDGPGLPEQDGAKLAIEDGPAAMSANGNVLFGAGVGDVSGRRAPVLVDSESTTERLHKTNGPTGLMWRIHRIASLLAAEWGCCSAAGRSSFYAYHSDARFHKTVSGRYSDVPVGIYAERYIQVSGLQFNGSVAGCRVRRR